MKIFFIIILRERNILFVFIISRGNTKLYRRSILCPKLFSEKKTHTSIIHDESKDDETEFFYPRLLLVEHSEHRFAYIS